MCNCHQICPPEPSRSSRGKFTFVARPRIHGCIRTVPVLDKRVQATKTVTHFSLLGVKSDENFTLLTAVSLASSYLNSSLQKCPTVIEYSPHSPPAVVVGISPSFPVPTYMVLNCKWLRGMLTGKLASILLAGDNTQCVTMQGRARLTVGHESQNGSGNIQAYGLGGQGTEEYRHPLKSTALALRGSRYRVLRTR